MNIDENVRKMLMLLLRKWKVLVVFAIIGGILGFAYTYHFVTPKYTSTVEFQVYAVDKASEIADNENMSGDAVRISQTSKINYAMKMIDTYIEIMNTNDFNTKLANELNKRINSDYGPWVIKGSTTVESVENTAMFKVITTTTDSKLSYEIAHQLELTVPGVIDKSSNGLVNARVEDSPVESGYATSKGYPKKCAISTMAGLALAAAYIILRNLLDIRVKSADDLVEAYHIPVLASIPTFEGKTTSSRSAKSTDLYGIYASIEKEVD